MHASCKDVFKHPFEPSATKKVSVCGSINTITGWIQYAAKPYESQRAKRVYKKRMVYDNIDNIKFYKGLSGDIYLGLEFLKTVTLNRENGVHELSPRVKAIVSEYQTREVNEYGFEAHRKFIDIQYLLRGSEKVFCLPIEELQETKPYQEDVEAAFYRTSIKPIEMTLGNGYFAIFYPQDGHMPGLCVEKPESVKKVVVKVQIGE